MLDTSNDVLQQVTTLRQKLIDRGFEPIAVRSGEKRPVDTAWQRRPLSTRARVGETNTGLRCGTIIAADIDIDDPTGVDEAVAAVERVAGPTPLIRWRESSPRVLMVYRAGEELKKRVLPVGSGKIEFLAEGQQFVSHGTHPCGDAFQWREMAPEDIDLAALPTITGAAIDEIGRILGVEPQGVPEGALVPSEAQVQPASVAPAGAAPTGRERAWALAALEGVVAEIAATPEGSRSDTLNKGAFRLGGIVARGWLSAVEAEEALRGAVVGWANLRKTLATLRRGLREGQKAPHVDLSVEQDDPTAEERQERLVQQLEAAYPAGAIVANKPATKRRRLRIVPASDFAGKPVPERKWIVDGLIPARNVTLLSGDGGVGKSLLALQLGAAMATGTDWIGFKPEPGRVLYLSAEDDEDELHRRVTGIAETCGLRLPQLQDLLLVPLAGEDAILAASKGREDAISPTALWAAVQDVVLREMPSLVIIDTAADTFGGDEVNRAEVRGFIGLLRGLAIQTGSTVLLLSHPSVAGMFSGTGLSGSTAWSNSVRSRLYFTRPMAEPGEHLDPDLRQLQLKKTNYAGMGETIIVRWHDGVFILAEQNKLPEETSQEQVERVFLSLVEKYHRQGRPVCHTPSSTYAPTVFEKDPDAGGIRKRAFAGAALRVPTRPASWV
jgi:RecA-family ATPase